MKLHSLFMLNEKDKTATLKYPDGSAATVLLGGEDGKYIACCLAERTFFMLRMKEKCQFRMICDPAYASSSEHLYFPEGYNPLFVILGTLYKFLSFEEIPLEINHFREYYDPAEAYAILVSVGVLERVS